MDVITHDESAAVFSWKGEIPKEYWECIPNALIQPEHNGKGHKPDLIVDDGDGGEMNIIIHDGNNAVELFLRDGTISDPISTDNFEFKIVQTIIKRQIEGGETDKWNKFFNTCMGVFDNNSTEFHHL